jgi:sialate O-acetylesterase
LNIHPKNKTDAALSLANMALNRHYKKLQIEDSGLLFKQLVIEKNKAIISFDHSEGLHSKGDKHTCFEIAGDNMVFYPADAKKKANRCLSVPGM